LAKWEQDREQIGNSGNNIEMRERRLHHINFFCSAFVTMVSAGRADQQK